MFGEAVGGTPSGDEVVEIRTSADEWRFRGGHFLAVAANDNRVTDSAHRGDLDDVSGNDARCELLYGLVHGLCSMPTVRRLSQCSRDRHSADQRGSATLIGRLPLVRVTLGPRSSLTRSCHRRFAERWDTTVAIAIGTMHPGPSLTMLWSAERPLKRPEVVQVGVAITVSNSYALSALAPQMLSKEPLPTSSLHLNKSSRAKSRLRAPSTPLTLDPVPDFGAGE